MDARRALAVTLTLLSYALRILAVLMCALVVVLCFSGMSARLGIVGLVTELSRAMPNVIAGYGVISSPFGGVFRLDFTIVAVCLFLLDYLCAKLAHSLR